MNDVTSRFLAFLADEYGYLSRIKQFLERIPELIPTGEITNFEFQNFLEKHELETFHYLYEKNKFKQEIADKLKIPAEKVTFKLLVTLGYKEFEIQSKKVLKLSNEISLLMMKVSIFLVNYTKLQREFKRLNTFLYRRDYSARGQEHTYDPGRNFYREA